MDERMICSECLGLKTVACFLPNGRPLCLDCVVKGMKDHDDKIEVAKKRACIEAKLTVVARMERECRKMHEEILQELDALGLSVEARVEFLLKNGSKIAAIKLHRDAHGCSMMEAKKYVDDLENW